MATTGIVGSLAGIWRFPVKSMRGEQIGQAELSERGLLGDRAYALIDTDTGKVASAKSVRLFPDLLNCRASFVEPPQMDRELPPVRIVLPKGASVTSDSSEIDRILSAHFRRDVTLARTAPENFTIDQYHPDIEELDHRNTIVEEKLGSAFFAQAGLASPVPVGAFFDLFPLSVLTTSSLEHFNQLRPQSRFDERRFRMNLILSTRDPGVVENGWIGKELRIGEKARISVALPDPRCVMTTLAQDDLPNDTDVLRTLAQHNKVQVGAAGQFPCAGAYALVVRPGEIRSGAAVTVE